MSSLFFEILILKYTPKRNSKSFCCALTSAVIILLSAYFEVIYTLYDPLALLFFHSGSTPLLFRLLHSGNSYGLFRRIK